MLIIFFYYYGVVGRELVPEGRTDASSHFSLIVTRFLAKHVTKVIVQPPYSTDSAPCDYNLFLKFKYLVYHHALECILFVGVYTYDIIIFSIVHVDSTSISNATFCLHESNKNNRYCLEMLLMHISLCLNLKSKSRSLLRSHIANY